MCILVVEMHQKHSIVQNLHNVTTCSAFLIITRGILEDVAAAEGFTITTCFNQIKCLNFIITSRIMLIVCASNIIFQFFKDYILTIFVFDFCFISRLKETVSSPPRKVIGTSCAAPKVVLLKLMVSGLGGKGLPVKLNPSSSQKS